MELVHVRHDRVHVYHDQVHICHDQIHTCLDQVHFDHDGLNVVPTCLQGGVTPIDSIVTAATALSQRSTVKPSE